MKATDILMEEHRIILNVLACLHSIVVEAEKGKLNAESAKSAIDFFRNFADGCHHAKEEDRLFVVMHEHGFPRESGPIGVMLTEHEDGRRFVRGMARALDRASRGESEAINEFSENARDFIALLQAHIDKEDHVLFPMADQTLADEAANALLADFKKIESDAGGQRHSDYIEVAKQLCDRYGIEFVGEAQLEVINSEFNV